ncbi:hypothetical protein Adi01nite_25770 [Amorphoplanes digitatis]|uniref:Succinate dehydrogenase/fumarate reductase flavoprotein subunit n=1 Tax=Actinoplanes digitatis TaxID=1868 RepID=A0A7W7HZC2_9ACTN|nr:FAD-dependent oxidoreductase [Actinoplanes digitatis]MBB4763576.1 succinate dehydrogenase/fumarate reductase flavoprotein subunit [Actinoplanes digitatis]BFE72728.1 hypothetical protein GCM10020092_060290 [Actinoplanes digitatis]GID93165.1 hypothetical protein Adi01nite_25770 [Actinoplanes digitatis]
MVDFDREVDVLVVGTGAAGFATALGAIDDGLSVLMVESTGRWAATAPSPAAGCGCPTTR